MMRRAARLLCAAGAGAGGGEHNQKWYQAEGENPNVSHDYMTLQNACGLFGYQLSDKIEKKELKKRFNKLAMQHHPDHGGTEDSFRRLVEAHKLLQEARHDKGGAEGRFKFHKARSPAQTHRSTSAPSSDNPFGEEDGQDKKFDMTDVFVFFAVMFVAIFLYTGRMFSFNDHLQRSRGRLTEEEMADATKLMKKKDWHPWGASQDERDQMDKLAVIQGSVRQEVIDEKIRARGELPNSPFSRSY